MQNTYKTIFRVGPYPAEITDKVDAFLQSKGVEPLVETKNMTDRATNRSHVVMYWGPDFGVAVEYEPNARKQINSIKLSAIGNGRFPQEFEQDISAMLKTIQESP